MVIDVHGTKHMNDSSLQLHNKSDFIDTKNKQSNDKHRFLRGGSGGGGGGGGYSGGYGGGSDEDGGFSLVSFFLASICTCLCGGENDKYDNQTFEEMAREAKNESEKIAMER